MRIERRDIEQLGLVADANDALTTFKQVHAAEHSEPCEVCNHIEFALGRLDTVRRAYLRESAIR